MIILDLQEPIGRLARFFRDRQTRAGVVARRLLGQPDSADGSLIEQLIRERRRRTRLDGSVDGSLQATTEAAWDLLELGCTQGHAGLDRMIGYLLARQDQPGRFGEGCSEHRHEIAHCNHYLSGFFSPGSRDDAVAPVALRPEAVVVTEFGARFGLSCHALRTVLRAGEDRRDAVRRHVEGLLLLAQRWEHGEFPRSLDLAFAAFAALGLAPPGYRDRVVEAVRPVLAMQDENGEWPGGSLFHALDCWVSLQAPETYEAVSRSLPALLARQRPNGAFDHGENEELALVALRALRSQGAPRPQRTAPAPTPARGR